MAGGKYLKEKPKSFRWLWLLAAAVLVVAVTAIVTAIVMVIATVRIIMPTAEVKISHKSK